MKVDNLSNLETFNALYECTNIPFYITSVIQGKVKYIKEESFPQKNKSLFKESFVLELIKRIDKSEVIIHFELDDILYVVATKLDWNRYMISYPIFSSHLFKIPVMSVITKYINKDKVNMFIKNIPDIAVSREAKVNNFCYLVRRICGNDKKTSIKKYIYKIDATENLQSFIKKDEKNYEDENENFVAHHHLPEYHMQMSNAIASGDKLEFLKNFDAPTIGSKGKMSENPLQNAKFGFICGIFSMSRSAIRGGLNSEFALRLSDKYCQKMDNLLSVKEINLLLREIGVKYCDFVRGTKFQSKYSQYTRIVIDYVHAYIHQKITLEKLSFEANLNRKSLAEIFLKDVGMSIHKYVMKKRLEEARTLLYSTNLTFVQISEMLCFSSQSYFIKKYKEEFGITPQQHRNIF